MQDPRVLDAMLPFLVDDFGNPHSRNHKYGWVAEEAVELARKVYRCNSLLGSVRLGVIILNTLQETVEQHLIFGNF